RNRRWVGQTLCKAAILETNPDKLAICDRGGRAGHRSTRITCGYYRTRASQVGGCPFSAQDLEQNFHAVRGNTFQARSELCFRKASSLLHGTRYGRKDVICIAANQTNRTNDNH